MKMCDLIIVAAAVIVLGSGAAQTQDLSFGQRLFRDKADCQFCHGINGDGARRSTLARQGGQSARDAP
jgi:hypothetical protein